MSDSMGRTLSLLCEGKKEIMPRNRGHHDLRLDESGRNSVMEIHAAAQQWKERPDWL